MNLRTSFEEDASEKTNSLTHREFVRQVADHVEQLLLVRLMQHLQSAATSTKEWTASNSYSQESVEALANAMDRVEQYSLALATVQKLHTGYPMTAEYLAKIGVVLRKVAKFLADLTMNPSMKWIDDEAME